MTIRPSMLIAALVVALAPAALANPGKSHDVTATVVAADAAKNMLTIKGEDGKEATAPVEGAAQKALADLKPGDKVTVTCRDDDKGNHVAVSAIKKAG